MEIIPKKVEDDLSSHMPNNWRIWWINTSWRNLQTKK